MKAYSRLPLVFGLTVGLLAGTTGSALLSAAEYGPKPGQAPRQTRLVARVQGEEEKAGQVVVRLSGEIVLTILVEGPAAPDELVQPVPAGGDWEVRKAIPARTEALPDGRVRWSQTFHLEPMKKDEVALTLAPLTVGGTSVSWEPITIRVTTDATADLNDMRDITPPEQLPPPEPWLPHGWLWPALGLVLAALVLGGWKLRRRWARQQPARSPAEWAVQELDRLDKQEPASAAEVEQYHTQLSDVVRRYLELRFELHAPRQTTAEFLEAMQQAPQLAPEQQTGLRDFLERCDLVKFAGVQPSQEECRTASDMARRLVRPTVTAEAPRI